MKIIEIEGKTYTDIADIPDPLKLSVGTISPVTEKSLLRYGARIYDDGEIWTAKEKEFQALPCCTNFKTVCGKIAEFLEVEEFLGGYDDIQLLATSEKAQENPVQALMLGQMWQAADDECNYKAERLGISRPRWWYCCWDINPDNPEVAANGPVNAE